MFSSENKTKQQAGISQLCAVFMVNALSTLSMFGVLLSETPMMIRELLKNVFCSAKDLCHWAFTLADHPSKLRRYPLLANTDNDLSFGFRQLINQNKRGTEA